MVQAFNAILLLGGCVAFLWLISHIRTPQVGEKNRQWRPSGGKRFGGKSEY